MQTEIDHFLTEQNNLLMQQNSLLVEQNNLLTQQVNSLKSILLNYTKFEEELQKKINILKNSNSTQEQILKKIENPLFSKQLQMEFQVSLQTQLQVLLQTALKKLSLTELVNQSVEEKIVPLQTTIEKQQKDMEEAILLINSSQPMYSSMETQSLQIGKLEEMLIELITSVEKLI